MKKTVVIFTVVSLMFFMTACNSSAPDENDDVANAAEVDGKTDSEAAREADEDSQSKGDGSVNNDGANADTEQGQDEKPDKTVQEPTTESDMTSDVRDTDSQPLTKKEAEELVRNHLDLTNRPEVKVQYDHEEQGRYVIHVYEIVGEGEASHTATLGWYYVNPKTQEIESMF